MDVSILQHAKDKAPRQMALDEVVELIKGDAWPAGYQPLRRGQPGEAAGVPLFPQADGERVRGTGRYRHGTAGHLLQCRTENLSGQGGCRLCRPGLRGDDRQRHVGLSGRPPQA